MTMVLITHAVIAPLGGMPTHEMCQSQPWISILRCEFGSFAVLGVNIFVLISGWFGVRLSTKSVINILFQIVFYRIVIGVIFAVAGQSTWTEAVWYMLPGNKDWFSRCYLLMLLFTPPINCYLKSKAKELYGFVGILLAFQIIFGWLVPVWPEFNHGYSVISFIILYMIGRRMRALYDSGMMKTRLSLPMLCSVIAVCGLAVWALCYMIPHEGICGWIRRWDISYASPLNIAFAAGFIMLFARFSFKSVSVNRLASSAFAVYLIHENPLVRPFYHSAASWIFSFGNAALIFVGVIVLAIATYMVCFSVDRVRLALWNRIIRTDFIDNVDGSLKSIFSQTRINER